MKLDSRLAAAGIMVAVFLSGAITGGVLSRAVLDDGPPFDRPWERDGRRGDWRGPDRGPDRRPGEDPDHDRRDRPREPRGVMSSRAVDHLAERLELTDAQRDSLVVILERQRERASAVFEDVGPRLRAVLDSTTSHIRAMLDPEQQAEFDAIVQEDRDVLGRRFAPPDSARRR